MKKYTFTNGDVMTSELHAEELMKRLRRLDTLRVMVEQNDCEEGRSICKKALRAYNKMENYFYGECYYEIDSLLSDGYTYKLWESVKDGDEVASIVTMNDVVIGETYDSLESYLRCYNYI